MQIYTVFSLKKKELESFSSTPLKFDNYPILFEKKPNRLQIMGKNEVLNKIRLKTLKKAASSYSIVPVSEVTEGAVEVWRGLPGSIRDDPSLAPFREQHEKLHGKLNLLF